MENNIHFTVQHNQDELGIDDAIIIYNDFKEGYVFPIENLDMKAEKLNSFISDLNQTENFTKYDYSRSKNNVFYKYISENMVIYVRGNKIDILMDFYTKTEKVSEDAFKIYMKYTEPSSGVECFYTSYFMNGNQVDSNSKVKTLEDFNYISELYYPYIKTDVMFEQFFTGDENILLLVGEPGIGKSKLSSLALKFAFQNTQLLPYDKQKDNPGLEEQYISAGYVKSTEVLSDDKFWRQLEKGLYDFVIIDDLDYMLTKRDAELQTAEDKTKNDFLNQFLSFTDGVEKNHTKFIITTNQRYDDIDSALLRKGRLFNILELRSLDKAEALAIWLSNKLSEKEFNELYSTQHDILPADLGSEISKRLNDRIETACEDYLLEEGISKILNAKRKKKVGL